MDEHAMPEAILAHAVWPRVRYLAQNWWMLLLAATGGAALGATVHFLRPKTFVSTGLYVLVTPQSPGVSASSLTALASQFGLGTPPSGAFDLNTLARIARSRRAMLDIIHSLDRRAVSDLVIRDPWHQIARNPTNRSPGQHEALLRRVENMMQLSVDPRSGTFDLGAKSSSPSLSEVLAEVCAGVLDSLTTDLLSTQVRLLREEAERQAEDAHGQLREAENRLESFLSKNRAFTAPALEFQARQLERDANLRTTLYSQLANRLAEARLEERRNTPALIAVSPPPHPVRPQGPSGRALVVLGGFFGGAITMLGLLWRHQATGRS